MNAHDDVEAYAIGALDARDAAAFETHLAMCAECRDALASYGGVMRALRSLPAAVPPAAHSPRPRLARFAWAAAVAAAAAAGVAVGHGVASGGANTDLATIAALLADRPHQVALAGPAGHGMAIVGARGGSTAFVIDGLPAPPAGRGYQVWVRGAGVTSPGMLHRTSTGLEVLVVPGDALAGAQHIGITEEPAAGSPARTGAPQVTGEVS